MPYMNRQMATRKRAGGSAELLYLLIVLAAGMTTAWWASGRIGMNLSSVTAAVSMLGLTDTGRSTHGAVGYMPSAPVAAAEQQAPTAPFCTGGQMPSFSPAAAVLRQQLGDSMGVPVECEHGSGAVGDTVQQTSTGLVAYTRLTDTVSFTDGWRHWAITPRGFIAWEGTESNPPAG
jgi:hypothetical protein